MPHERAPRGPARVQDRADGRRARDVVRQDEEGRRTGDDAQAVALPEAVEDVVLRLGGLAVGPLPVGRVLVDRLVRPEAPNDGCLALLDERAWRTLRKLYGTSNIGRSYEDSVNTHVLEDFHAGGLPCEVEVGNHVGP